MMPHTPGPWTVIPLDEDGEEMDIVGPRHVDEDGCEYIATVYGCDGVAANARLIAVAPEMYDLLKEIQFKGYSLEECPICSQTEFSGHAEDCRLAAVLKAVEGE